MLELLQTAYLQAAEFTESESGEHWEWAESAIKTAQDDCAKFVAMLDSDLLAIVKNHVEQTGHDIWLNRNGHGVGFWDRPEIYGDGPHDQLSDIAETMGESYAYLGDDGLAYLD